MTDKTFTVAGTSIRQGEKKNRFANGTAAARYKILEKDGQTEILLFDLPKPMTQDEATAWLNANGTTTVAVSPSTTPAVRAPRTPKATGPTKFRAPKTGTATSTYDLTYTPDEIKTSPVVRAIHEAGANEMVVSAEIEAEAHRLHKESVVDHLTWTQLDVSTRNEFRATVIHCPKAKVA